MEKFLYSPVDPYHVNQAYGEDTVCYNPQTGKLLPKPASGCPAGTRSPYGPAGHNGLDMRAQYWQPVYSPCDGQVVEVSTERERGLGIGIVGHKARYFTETSSTENWKVRLWHFNAINVDLGQLVKMGDLIGYAGATGYASGPHVHFELKPIQLQEDGGYKNILQDNGAYGAIDPAPYLVGLFALDIGGLAGTLRRLREVLALLTDKLGDRLRR